MSESEEFCFSKNAEICVFSIFCREKIMQALYLNLYSLLTTDFTLNDKYILKKRFYRNVGRAFSVKFVYNNNIESTYAFENNKTYYIDSTEDGFRNTDNRVIVLEVLFDCENGQADVTDFQYLLLSMKLLDNVGIKYCVMFSGKSAETNKRFYPLNKHDYFRIRTYLCMEDISSYWNQMFCLVNPSEYRQEKKESYSSDLSEQQAITKEPAVYIWQRVFGEQTANHQYNLMADNKKHFGKVLPVININENNYNFLLSRKHCTEGETTPIEDCWVRILKQYKDKSLSKLNERDKDIAEEYYQSDNYFESLLFFSMMTFLMYQTKVKPEEYDLAVIHEYCMDFSQGVFQLVENVLVHVIGNERKGCGNITLRIREKDRMENILCEDYLKKSERIGKARFFFEIFVSDAHYDIKEFKGIIDKFIDNAKKRRASEDVVANAEKIRLRDLFEENEITKSYLSNYENTAYHYGLQILDNVIKSNDGCFSVRSGFHNEDLYSNNTKIYKEQSISWFAGTAYKIYLPISLTENTVAFQDTIAVKNIEKRSEKVKAKKICADIKCDWSPFDKMQRVDRIKREILEDVSKKSRNVKNIENLIFYIDCSVLQSCIEYEILAKAIFSCLAEKNDLYHIALVNVKNEYEVIKLFRQFALFYDRNGENTILEDKSIFIVDKDAKLDFILEGSLSSIISYMESEQIYGGIEEREMRIVCHLGGRENVN